VFDQPEYFDKPRQEKEFRCFPVLESGRTVSSKSPANNASTSALCLPMPKASPKITLDQRAET
jgi:hypothetical protein